MSNHSDKKVIHSIRTQVDSFGRKKYRLQEVAQQASEEQEIQNNAIIDTGRHKSMLIGREQGLNIEKYVGKIDTNKKKKATQVFYCDVCSEGFKCDMAYITHLNSPAHNRKLGMNMKVKNVSFETVSSKISSLINKKQQKQQQEEEDQLLEQIQNNNHQQKRKQLNKKLPQTDKNQSEHDDQQVEQNEQVDQNENVEQQQEEEENDQDSNLLAEMQMMKKMGLPTAFGSKKHKR